MSLAVIEADTSEGRSVGLLVGAMATATGLHNVIGHRATRVHPKAFNYWPLGHRLMVVADFVPETLESGLALPQGTRQRTQETIGAGVVMAVGPLVGMQEDRTPHPGGPVLTQPADLLYQHVLFSAHAGAYVQLFFSEKPQWDQHVVMLTDRDLWVIDTSPKGEWGLIG